MKEKKTLLKFIVTGGICTSIDFLVYMGMSTRIGLSVAKCISMVCSCTVSFFLNKLWTFEDRKKIYFKQVLNFIGVQIVNISVNVVSNQLIYEVTQIKILSFLFATLLAMIVNYLLQKKMVFREV